MGVFVLQVVIDIFVLFLLLPRSHGFVETVRTTNESDEVLAIGVILNFDSLGGKEAWKAMEIASQNFNAMSRGYKFQLHRENSGGKPLQAVSSAKNLIEKKRVIVIIGLETWKEAELVAELGIQVPVISLARNHAGTVIPGLIQMGSEMSEQIKCMVNIVWSYNRNRVSIIYEDKSDDDYHSASLYLSQELHKIGSEIENRVVLPVYSSLSDPKSFVHQKLQMFEHKLCPVIIVLDLSLPMASHLFKEAKQMGLFKGDSVWILSESVLNILDSVDSEVTAFMKGAMGITTDVPRKSKQYLDFIRKFRKTPNHKDHGFSPGFHALIAYDSVTLVTKAGNEAASGNSTITKQLLLERMLQSKFDGLSGQVMFKDSQISSTRKMNVTSIIDKKSYENLDIEALEKTLDDRNAVVQEIRSVYPESRVRVRASKCTDADDSEAKKIGVPRTAAFDIFVKEDTSGGKTEFSGFCIDVFDRIVSNLSNFEPYCFVPHDGTYNDLVEKVHNRIYDAAVGDITIIADRLKNVSFTQPFLESTLSMIVLAEKDDKTWILVKPFTLVMWISACCQLIVIMLTVWCLESPTNEAFQGSRTDQMATAMWFTLSALFFAQRELIHRNLTRVVVVTWFFVALVLTQSYSANLTSMLTVQKIKQNKITIDWLQQHNSLIGCDNATFLCKSLNSTQDFHQDNIRGFTEYTNAEKMLKNKNVSAVFVEYPYAKAFLNRYCEDFTITNLGYRFGGFGFAFHKDSNWTDKFSEVILELSESGWLHDTTDAAFQGKCSKVNANATASLDSDGSQSLGIESFWPLFVFTIGISLISILLSFFFPLTKSAANEPLNEAPGHVQDQEAEMLPLHGHMIQHV